MQVIINTKLLSANESVTGQEDQELLNQLSHYARKTRSLLQKDVSFFTFLAIIADWDEDEEG